MSELLRIFIGYDSNETVAYHVLCQSIIRTSSAPVSLTPIALSNIASLFKRERSQVQSTEFSFSRFLVPHLSQYEGWALYLDCDMLVRSDIAQLFNLRNESYSVMVCKHDYIPKDTVKFLGHAQTRYEKKNWSSVMLFNNSRCTALTPSYVNSATGLELHQFKWLDTDSEIGSLPLDWNWLVGEYQYNHAAKIAHFTRGGPYFNEYKQSDYSEEWFSMLREITFAAQCRA